MMVDITGGDILTWGVMFISGLIAGLGRGDMLVGFDTLFFSQVKDVVTDDEVEAVETDSGSEESEHDTESDKDAVLAEEERVVVSSSEEVAEEKGRAQVRRGWFT